MKKNAFTIIEFIVSCIIIFVLAGVGFLHFKKTLKSFREVALKSQLEDIRLSLKLYELFHNKYPEDIRSLLTEEVNMMPYSSAVLKKKYIESVRSDNEGFPLDPFGNKFVYRADRGEIKTQTKGYENW